IICIILGAPACGSAPSSPDEAPRAARLPLVLVSDVDLPGGATRFDYQYVDPGRGRLVIAHMGDNTVLVVDLRDGSVLKEVTGIPVARGVIAAAEVGIIF